MASLKMLQWFPITSNKNPRSSPWPAGPFPVWSPPPFSASLSSPLLPALFTPVLPSSFQVPSPESFHKHDFLSWRLGSPHSWQALSFTSFRTLFIEHLLREEFPGCVSKMTAIPLGGIIYSSCLFIISSRRVGTRLYLPQYLQCPGHCLSQGRHSRNMCWISMCYWSYTLLHLFFSGNLGVELKSMYRFAHISFELPSPQRFVVWIKIFHV